MAKKSFGRNEMNVIAVRNLISRNQLTNLPNDILHRDKIFVVAAGLQTTKMQIPPS